MLTDLDESLRQLLIQKAGLDPAEVDISFDLPTRDWAASSAAGRPTVNLYLYDIHENRTLREMHWDHIDNRNGTTTRKRRPLRLDIAYMITCWTTEIEDQHRLLWRVIETFCRHSPLPADVLQGDLLSQTHPIRTEVAQSDGSITNTADYWAGLENNLRPGIRLKATIELDLDQVDVRPLVFARIMKLGRPATDRRVGASVLGASWEPSRVQFGGTVQLPGGAPFANASVRLIGVDPAGRPVQVGSTQVTGPDGRYRFAGVPVGAYTLVVETPGQPPRHTPVELTARDRAEPMPELTRNVEVMPASP